MARTPDRTRLQDFVVTSGDEVSGEDLTTGTSLPLRGGNSTTAGNDGADVTIAGGINTNGTPGNTNGGSVVLTPGNGTGTGVQGLIAIGSSGALQFLEAAVVPGPTIVATQGRVWVRSDTPNVLVFTDDAGTDWVLNSGVGASSLAATLAVGNTTGGNDIILTTADSILGEDAAAGGSLDLRAGNSSTVGTAGANVTITGGDTAATGAGAGGSIILQGRTPQSATGTGGSISLLAGNGGTGVGNAQGGGVTITGGDAVTSAQGGGVTVTGGQSLGAVVAGAAIAITGGENLTATGAGGVITLTGGTGQRNGGDVTIKGGTKNAAGAGFTSGDILIESGDIGGTSGYDFGNITIQVPDPVTPSAHNVLGGSITIKAGTTGIRNANGGDVSITAGDTFGSNTRIGGSIFLTAGDENNGSAASDGGLIVMTPGTSVSGEDGRVQLLGTGTLEMLERAAATGTPVAGRGYVWVRNDSPNVLIFTDDTGANTVLGASGASTLQEAYVGGNTITTSGGEGNFDVSGTEAISLDASMASNFTVAGASLTLETTGSGSLIATSAGVWDLNAGANLDIDVTGTYDMLSSGAFSIDGTGASNVTAASGTLTVSTTTSGTLAVTSAGILDLDSGTASDVTVTSGVGSSSVGGAVTVVSGAGNGAFNGGAIGVTAGDSGAGATGNGGTITLTAGDAASTNGDGGSIVLNPGALSGTGTDGEVTVNGKLTVTGLIDPTGLVLAEQSVVPYTTTAGDGTLWVRDDAVQTLMFTDDAGTDIEVAGGGVTRMQEILLSVRTVNTDPLGNPAGGVPNGGVPVALGENTNSRIQYLEFGKSTEDDYGASWDIVLPDNYSGKGLTIEFWITGDGSSSAAADFTAAFDREETGRDIDTGGLWGTSQTATGTTISATPWITVMATVTFTNSQIDSMVAGDGGRVSINRLQSDAYAGVVRMTKARMYETP